MLVLALPVPTLESWRLRLGVAALFMVVNTAVRALRAVAIAAGVVGEYTAYFLTYQVLLLATVALLAATGVASSAVWVLAYVGAGALPTIWWTAHWLRRGVPRPSPATDDLGRARREGLQLLPATVAHSGTLRVDRLLLAGLASTAELGRYAAVATMTELIAWPLMAWADSRLGRWREDHDRGALCDRPPARTLCVSAAGRVGQRPSGFGRRRADRTRRCRARRRKARGRTTHACADGNRRRSARWHERTTDGRDGAHRVRHGGLLADALGGCSPG